MAEDLESRARKAVIAIKKRVDKIYDILMDVGLKITYVLEHKFSDYYSMPKGKIDYNNCK